MADPQYKLTGGEQEEGLGVPGFFILYPKWLEMEFLEL